MRLLLLLFAAPLLFAQPVLRTELRKGVTRAAVAHASSGAPVTDEDPAVAGETLLAAASDVDGPVVALMGDAVVEGQLTEAGEVEFVAPAMPGGGFVELSLATPSGRSNQASLPLADAGDGVQLTAAEAHALVMRAVLSLDAPGLVVAISDRAGNPLAIYRRPGAGADTVEAALSAARTGAFFSHNEAPLSSRTVRSISRANFPEGIPNQPAGALFGIEATNRGCRLTDDFLPNKAIPPSRNADGAGPGRGIATVPGGLPVYRDGAILIGGIGVAGVDPNQAEFAAVSATFGTPFFVKTPLPFPGAVFIDGFRLPFVSQTTRPAGAAPAGSPGGEYLIGPLAGMPAPDGWLAGPKGSPQLSADEVRAMVERAIARAAVTRAQIRLPLGTRTKMAISVSNLDGEILALYRMPDATMFSVDVAATKARNVVYFSSTAVNPADLPGVPPGTAVTNRTIGFGAQPYFPSGILNSSPGPFRDLFQFDAANPCSQGRQPANRNQSGVVFFPGSAPLYKDGRLAGGLGVSGDGVEQDDYVTAAGAEGFEAPDALRADQVFLRDVRLPYWKFPRNPEQ